MPNIWMLVGIPASGKSTWVKEQGFDPETTVIISTDDIIERRAAAVGKTYSEVFQAEYKSASGEMNKNLHNALAENKDIVWDQTNTTVKSRHAKLAMIPHRYNRIAVVFASPSDHELNFRLMNRPGKNIPWNVINGMKNSFEVPSLQEGFSKIISVGFDGDV
jgi:hypothetical protein